MINNVHKEFFESINFKPRKAQEDILDFFEQNKTSKYFVIDAPTGCGKTHIALARSSGKRTYILTSSKFLQNQYLSTYNNVVLLKGKANYPCYFNSELNCENGLCFSFPIIKKKCQKEGLCPYFNKLKEAIASNIVITNYDYFIYASYCGPFSKEYYESKNKIDEYERKIVRDDLICDEAHNLEDKLIGFAELTINKKELEDIYKINFDENEYFIEYDDESNIEIIKSIFEKITIKCEFYKNRIDIINYKYENEILNLFENKILNKFKMESPDENSLKKLNKLYYKLDKIKSKLNVYIINSKNNKWLYKVNSKKEIFLSPLNASGLFSEYFEQMARNFIFMSATIGFVDEFIKEIGLDKNLTNFIHAKSDFDSKKSPIIYIPTCKMNYTEIDKNLPIISRTIDMIINENHKNDKGIIHTSNYKIADYIFKNIKNNSRLLYRDMNNRNRLNNYELIDKHKNIDESTILISPSMIEGISLDDDLSRFQIIVKLPFLSLANFRTATKMKINNEWYTYKMWINLMQGSGRSTRSNDDYSITYILDSSFEYFFKLSKNKLSNWFIERIKI